MLWPNAEKYTKWQRNPVYGEKTQEWPKVRKNAKCAGKYSYRRKWKQLSKKPRNGKRRKIPIQRNTTNECDLIGRSTIVWNRRQTLAGPTIYVNRSFCDANCQCIQTASYPRFGHIESYAWEQSRRASFNSNAENVEIGLLLSVICVFV